MKIHVTEDAQEMSRQGKEIIVKMLNENPKLALGGATGNTPKILYGLLAEAAGNGQLDLAKREIWFLDEYFGKAMYYQYGINFLHTKFPAGKGIAIHNIHVPNGMYYWEHHIVHSEILDSILRKNPGDYAMKGPEVIIKPEAKHPVLRQILNDVTQYENNLPGNRVQILGIGVEGHIGFNEVGTREDSPTHLTVLADSTVEANADDYEDGIRTRYAVTQGSASIMKAQVPVLFANGKKKSEAVHGLLVGDNPASVLRKHQNAHVYITRDTLGEFKKADFDQIKKEHEVVGI